MVSHLEVLGMKVDSGDSYQSVDRLGKTITVRSPVECPFVMQTGPPYKYSTLIRMDLILRKMGVNESSH